MARVVPEAQKAVTSDASEETNNDEIPIHQRTNYSNRDGQNPTKRYRARLRLINGRLRELYCEKVCLHKLEYEVLEKRKDASSSEKANARN